MSLNGVMAVTLRYTEFRKPAFQHITASARKKETSRSLSHLLMSFLSCYPGAEQSFVSLHCIIVTISDLSSAVTARGVDEENYWPVCPQQPTSTMHSNKWVSKYMNECDMGVDASSDEWIHEYTNLHNSFALLWMWWGGPHRRRYSVRRATWALALQCWNHEAKVFGCSRNIFYIIR